MNPTNILSIISDVQVPVRVIEDIVNHRTRNEKYRSVVTGIDENLISRQFETMVTYSLQASAKGRLQIRFTNEISKSDEVIQIPMASFFLVTCIKGKEEKYKMELGSSLN
jgi:hypothetical protein